MKKCFLCMILIVGNLLSDESNNEQITNVQVSEENGILISKNNTPTDLFENTTANEDLDYSYCKVYYSKASVSVVGNLRAIKLKSGDFVGYSEVRPQDNRIKKYDPFTGLFSLKNVKAEFSYDLLSIDNYAYDHELASVNLYHVNVGKFSHHQSGFLDYAKFSTEVGQNGVVGNICYQIYGIGTGDNNFIEKEYIDRFLESDDVYYADIGARFALVDPKSATFEIKYSDPFFKDNPFKSGDTLVSINDRAPSNQKELELLISDLSPDKIVNIKIRRNNEVLSFDIFPKESYGGYLLPDSFLERFNLVISNDFVINEAPKSGMFSNLKKGDKILRLNNIDISNLKAKTSVEKYDLLKKIFTEIQNDRVDRINKNSIPNLTSYSENVDSVFALENDLDNFNNKKSMSYPNMISTGNGILKNVNNKNSGEKINNLILDNHLSIYALVQRDGFQFQIKIQNE